MRQWQAPALKGKWAETRGRNENCLNDTPKTGADYKSHVEEDDTAGQNTDI